MSSNLIKNETIVFYTIQIVEGLFVESYDYGGGRVHKVTVTEKSGDAVTFGNKKMVLKISEYVKGEITKHTRTETITEVTEVVERSQPDEQ